MIKSFNLPTCIINRLDAIECIDEICLQLNLKKIFIVTGRSFAFKNGVLDKILGILDAINVRTYIFSQVLPEPESDLVDLALKEFIESKSDAIVSIGGGSVIDVSKFISVMDANGGKCTDYEQGKKIEKKGVPVIAIPTTAGTGSEVTPYSVINNSETKRKFTITHNYLYPDYAIVDSNLTLSLPKDITLATALDAWVHSLEGFVNKNNSILLDPYACKSINIIGNYLPKLMHDLDNLSYREKLSSASLMSGIVISQVRTGLIHTMSVALAKCFKLPHGLLNAIITPYVIEFNLNNYGERLISIVEQMSSSKFENDEKALNYIKYWLKSLGVPEGLSQFNITVNNEMIHSLIDRVNQDKGLPIVNPRKLTDKDLDELFKKIIRS